MSTRGIEIKNKGLLLIGIILLVIGVVLSLYKEDLGINGGAMRTAYPYQVVGIILVVAGIVFMTLGFLYSPRYHITALDKARSRGPG
jgi:drug/metabolite transporter (DMT)-like permease